MQDELKGLRQEASKAESRLRKKAEEDIQRKEEAHQARDPSRAGDIGPGVMLLRGSSDRRKREAGKRPVQAADAVHGRAAGARSAEAQR